jgi:thiamine-monophosphate kinase
VRANEFELIEEIFAPLAAGKDGTFDLTNDAALLPALQGERLIASVDTLIEGVHFLAGTAPEAVAAKALRVNLSDIAAMGGRPLAYLLALSLPRGQGRDWSAKFARGLSAEQARFGIYLLGGDTTATPGPLTISITLFATLQGEASLTRSGAGAGDLVYLSGSLGDAALGLTVARGGLSALSEAARHALQSRYECPEPRLALGQALLQGGLATAAMDVSDGLAQDLGHIARHSGLGARIERACLPLSAAAKAALAGDLRLWPQLLSGGDDYELLFTVQPSRAPEIEALSRDLGLPLSRIGCMEAGSGVQVFGPDGQPMALDRAGWSHF